MSAESLQGEIQSDDPPDGRISGLVRLLLIVFIMIALVLNMNKVGLINYVIDIVFSKSIYDWWIANIFEPTLIIDTSYYYLIIGLILSLVFLIYPMNKGAENRVPFYD